MTRLALPLLTALSLLSACGADAGATADAGDLAPDANLDAGAADVGARDAAPDVDLVEDAGGSPDAQPDAGEDAGELPKTFLSDYPLDVPHAESGTYDPVDHVFYVGSLVTGGVTRVDARTGEASEFYAEERPGEWWTLGLDVDVEGRRLMVCSMSDLRETAAEGEPDNLGYILEFDLDTGALTRRYDLGEAFETANCADVAFAQSGDAYVADRAHPNVYEITPAGELTLFATGEPLTGQVVGQNAIIVLPDQSALLSVVYLPSRLAHVRLDDATVTEVVVDGDFFDFIPPLSGADGMTWSGDAALIAFTSQLNRITPTSPDWSTASSQTVEVDVGMTDVVHTPIGDYLLNGQAFDFAVMADPDPTVLSRFVGEFE